MVTHYRYIGSALLVTWLDPVKFCAARVGIYYHLPSTSMSLPMASSTSASNTPESDSRGSTPGSRSVTTTPSGKGSNKTKPVNVFSNDGSFLERFQRIKKVQCLSYFQS